MYQNNEGVVKELYIAKKDKTRETLSEVTLDANGVQGDKFYGKNPERSILIASLDSYAIAKERGVEAEHGSLGENILIDINPYGLKQGDKVIIGDLELCITQNCTLCSSLSKVDNSLPKILKDDRGIFARALKSGSIKKGDKVLLKKGD